MNRIFAVECFVLAALAAQPHAVTAAPSKAEYAAILNMAPRTPWLTPSREVMNLGGPGAGWKATYTREVQGEFIKMAGDAKVYRWSDEPVDEAKAKWLPVDLPQPKFQATNWRLGVGWYERTFTLTAKQAARNVLLRFEQIGVHYRIWVNGGFVVDEPQGASFLETYDISPFVKAGENTIRIMVDSKKGSDDSWIDWPLNGVKHGITRPFYLEFRDKVAIDRVVVRTQVTPTKELAVSVCVTNMTDECVKREVKVNGEGEQWTLSSSVDLKPGEGKVVELKRPWPEARLWSPADPHLHWMNVAFGGDSYRVRFGFREVKWVGTGHRAMLNGKPFMMLRNTTAPIGYDDAKNLEIVNRLKRRGIVGFRYFTGDKPDLARFCDLCDEQGFLLATAACSGWGAGFKTDAFWPRWRRMLGKMIDQCVNSPALVCWGISNEFGTVYGGKDNSANAVRQGEVGEWVQRRDPTRPWECYGEIELRWHGKEGPMPIRSYHYPYSVAGSVLPVGGRWYADGKNGWQGAFTNDKPVVVSEDLFHGFQDSQATVGKAAVGDLAYTRDGMIEAMWYALRKYYEGYALGGIAGWDPWCFYVESAKNPVYDNPRGTPHPNRLLMLKEHPRNLFADSATSYTLVAINNGFAPVSGTIVRTVTAGGRKVATSKPVRLRLDAGEKREFPTKVAVPSVDKTTPAAMRLVWTADDGKTLADEVFEFQVVPRLDSTDVVVRGKVAAVVTATNSPLAQLAFKRGVHARAKDALAKEPEAVVVHGPLLPQDAQILDNWVATGGRVLQLEPKCGDWCRAQIPQNAGRMNYAFAFRRDDERMTSLPEKAMRLWAPDGYVGDTAFPKPKGDARILWDSIHAGGQQWAEVAWLWHGKGGWLVSTVPAFERLGVEPLATHFLQSLFDELVNEKSAAPTKTVVNVDLNQPPTSNIKPLANVYVADAKGTNLTAAAKAFVKAVAKRGGTALVLDMAKEDDPDWLTFLGITWERPLPPVMEPIPWNPSVTNEVDTSRRFFTRIGNANAAEIAGLNNEDFFWWKHDQTWVHFRYGLFGGYPTFKWQKQEGEPASAYFEATDKDTRILTTPAAIGVRTVRNGWLKEDGKVVFATFSRTKKGYGGDHPGKVNEVVKTILNNLGAATVETEDKSSYVPLNLAPYANACSWRKPGAEKLWFNSETKNSNAVDYRYFPVNRCGWSIAVQNFCPIDEFPDVPITYDGVPFAFVNPDKNGNRDLLFLRDAKKNAPLKIALAKPMKVKRLHFLGFGQWSSGADIWFGDQKTPVKMIGGDHVGNWANNWEIVKRGKRVHEGTWDVPHAERWADYKPCKAFAYHWFVENPESAESIRSITLGPGLSYFAVTVEE